MRPIVAIGIVVGAALSVLTGGAAGEVLPSDRTDPNHLRPHFRAYEPPAPLVPRLRYTESRAVYSLPKGLDGLAKIDKTLSRLCQRGAFNQKTDGYYWAATPERRFGVAFSGGANLEDPQQKRQPGKVYFFSGQDSRCTVYIGDQAKLMPHYIGP